MMTREEASEHLFDDWYIENGRLCVDESNRDDFCKALGVGIKALRPVSRERVERIRGEWVAKHRHRGGFRRVTGVDDMGEQRTITIDDRCEYDDRYCSKCGKQSPDNFLNFCGYCGAPMTDEAVEIRLKELEALKDGKGN